MSEAKAIMGLLMASATIPNSSLKAEVEDAIWADFGRMVHSRIVGNPNMVIAINRAGMRSKSVHEMVTYLRAYILTGTLP